MRVFPRIFPIAGRLISSTEYESEWKNLRPATREMSSSVNNCFARYLIDQKEMKPDGILPDVLLNDLTRD